jgi:hypothetical protein
MTEKTIALMRMLPGTNDFGCERQYPFRMDNEWAMDQLREFIQTTTTHTEPGFVQFDVLAASQAIVVESFQVVEQILNRITPNWVRGRPGIQDENWRYEHLAAVRALTQIQRADEIAEKLGEVAPEMSAGAMHRWAWDAARSLWQSRHYGEAVRAAIVKLNAEVQNKLQRPTLSETVLFQQALSSEPATSVSPRLRLKGDDGSKTSISLRRGVLHLAEGCFAAIRNPVSHVPIEGNDEQMALEQLALVSLLCRWMDEADVVTS